MSKIDLAGVAVGLGKALHVIDELMPIAEALGGPMMAPMANVIGAAGAIGETALKALADGKAVASSRDAGLIRQAVTDLEAKNDKLTALIEAS